MRANITKPMIQYSNALKIDKNFADAHYQLGQTYLHMGQLMAAYAEFTRTVNLKPSDVRARLDLGSPGSGRRKNR